MRTPYYSLLKKGDYFFTLILFTSSTIFLHPHSRPYTSQPCSHLLPAPLLEVAEGPRRLPALPVVETPHPRVTVFVDPALAHCRLHDLVHAPVPDLPQHEVLALAQHLPLHLGRDLVGIVRGRVDVLEE